MFATALQTVQRIYFGLDHVGAWLGLFVLRILLAVEFWASGIEKLNGQNWFADIQDRFPFPFNQVSPDFSWGLSTWFEIVGAIALVLGLGTRFFSVSLSILTVVAIAAVHWPEEWHSLGELAMGYAITDQGHGNFKLPLFYLVMFVPLILQGAGKLSLDHWLRTRRCGCTKSDAQMDRPSMDAAT